MRIPKANKNWLIYILIITFTTQMIAIEGMTISPIKVGVMSVMPISLFFIRIKNYDCIIYGILLLSTITFCAYYQNYVRISTILYMSMFIVTYITFTELLHACQIELNSFINLLRHLVFAYCIVLILQQICMLINIYNLPLINLLNQSYLDLFKLPSLSIEPSHSARILSVAYFSLIRFDEIQRNKKLLIIDLFSEKFKWITIAFLYTMLTMGSATAYIAIFIIALHFVNFKSLFLLIPSSIFVISILLYTENSQFQRVINVIEATISGDAYKVKDTDDSASARIIPLLNTLTIDLTRKESWIGNGTSQESSGPVIININRKTSIVEQYGLLTFIVSLIFIYKCCIKNILSIETCIFIFFMGASIGNIYYHWGILFMFTLIKFYDNKEINENRYNSIKLQQFY